MYVMNNECEIMIYLINIYSYNMYVMNSECEIMIYLITMYTYIQYVCLTNLKEM